MSGSHLPIGLEYVDFTAAYTVQHQRAGVSGRRHAGRHPRQRRQRWPWIFVVAGGSITANDIAVISTRVHLHGNRAEQHHRQRASLGKLVGKGRRNCHQRPVFLVAGGGLRRVVNAATSSGEYRAGQHHHGRASRRRVGEQLGQGDRARARGHGGQQHGGGDPQLPAIGTDD